MMQYKQNVIRYAIKNPDGRMPFRYGWNLLNKPEKRICYTGLKKMFGVESYESVRARISGDPRVKLSVSEAVRVATFFYAKFRIDNPWGDGTE